MLCYVWYLNYYCYLSLFLLFYPPLPLPLSLSNYDLDIKHFNTYFILYLFTYISSLYYNQCIILHLQDVN